VDRGRCNIDIRDSNELSLEEFQNKYFLREPVLIRSSNYVPSAIWTREYLIKHYGQSFVAIGSSR
jgi:hypothetical protein